ncbi:MAG: CPBP family intramembrane metalloprotease [Candidatus Lokiarchaeota archaeon]|nr:CPBP family intramembrane metalloprotease [Candidatus Lokiarchaeota archaeon]MBD3202363.1 CPBP family intramembrane metalloprotease [Candidatus Lokiarchaeota archaeon]
MIKIISTIIWQFIFSGFGEELRFRAYYQSIINLEYRRPYEILNVSFGPGLLIGTFLFGISHIFNSYSPFEGIFNLSWGGGIWTFAAGLFCGFLKEKLKTSSHLGLLMVLMRLERHYYFCLVKFLISGLLSFPEYLNLISRL